MYVGKRGSHTHKGPFCTLQPCSKSRGAKKCHCVKIFAMSNFKNFAPQKFNTKHKYIYNILVKVL